MRRRDVLILLSGAAVGWPLTALSQQGNVPRIGYLSLAPGPSSRSDALLPEGLRAKARTAVFRHRYAQIGSQDRQQLCYTHSPARISGVAVPSAARPSVLICREPILFGRQGGRAVET